MQYVRSFQWRHEFQGQDLFVQTGKAVAKLFNTCLPTAGTTKQKSHCIALQAQTTKKTKNNAKNPRNRNDDPKNRPSFKAAKISILPRRKKGYFLLKIKSGFTGGGIFVCRLCQSQAVLCKLHAFRLIAANVIAKSAMPIEATDMRLHYKKEIMRTGQALGLQSPKRTYRCWIHPAQCLEI